MHSVITKDNILEYHYIFRYPIFPEDENRLQEVGRYESFLEAQKWVESQEGEYFKPSDYLIVSSSG